ncbi:MAG: universal stress protein [Pyrinomonadaceae bacterium]
MIRKILFPTDFSAVANGAFPFVTTLAEACGATIVALHVSSAETRGAMGPSGDFPEPADSAVRMERSIISKAETETYAEVIIRKARARKCDLIVMASHGRSDVAQFFLGRSVAERVVRDSPTPAVVMRLFSARRSMRPTGRLDRLTYVTDLTDASRAVLPITADIARATGARINVLCVFAEGDSQQPADGGHAAVRAMMAAAGLEDALERIDTVRGGTAESIIVHTAENNTDLVAITPALCGGGDGDSAMTKTAEYVIRRAPCPVLGVRP